ncbi:UDP-4-amino-4,6-dideoxy-N-acetyl-beta-L-altrosamine transaminase [Synergistales bacterium]|nr:UDP-4-amino-4,6-dideoxy-N-acetyl-beta-L-altrosamine transaminase [Synergistales bacterium]
MPDDINKKYLPYGHQSINEDDIAAVVDVLRGDWLTNGPSVEKFERAVADYVGASHAVSFSSGTAALHGAMSAAGVSPGDYALVPAMTFAATANAAVYCGGRPLPADISPETLCLDKNAAASAAASLAGASVRAVAPVSFAGYPVDIEFFRELAERIGAALIEDAAHALGARRGSRFVGQDADMTVFSFHPVKHITTAEGGMVVTNSASYANSLRLFRSHGIVKSPEEFIRPYEGAWDNDMIELGYNYRLSDMASALGASQMTRLGKFVARRAEIAAIYRRELADTGGVSLPPDHEGHSYHLFPVTVSANRRKEIFGALRSFGVGVQVHYVPLHLHTYYRREFGFREGDFPNAEAFAAGTMSLPIYPGMTDDDAIFVSDKLKEILGKL